MRRWQLAVLFGCLLVTTALSSEAVEEDDYEDIEDEPSDDKGEEAADDADVVVMTDSNFDALIAKHKFALVEFYAPWCGHCKNLAPHYAKAATTLKAYNPEILIAKVDATENKEVAEKFSVQGYPTLKWFVDGKETEYNGGRDEEAIVNWVKKKTGPPTQTVKEVSELEAVEKANEVFIIGYFSALEGKDYESFVDAGRTADDMVFLETTSKEVAAKAGAKTESTPSVAIIKNFEGYDREVVHLAKEISVANMEELIVAERLPLIIPFVEKNQEKIFDSGVDTHLLMLSTGDTFKPGADFEKIIRAVAAKFKGKLMFVSVDLDDEAASQPVTNFFGATKADAPVLFGFQMNKNKKFKLDGKGLTEEKMTEWCQKLADGELEPIYKSQDPPENDLEDGVKIVVGKTVDSVVLDPTKDVLLEVYAPWCGHCKSLEPIYKKLGKRFSTVDSVVIAKMDGTENEHKEIEVSGFPSLFFFPAGAGAEKVSYDEGDRSLLAMTKFIKKHAKIPYELPKKAEAKKEEATDEPEEQKTEL